MKRAVTAVDNQTSFDLILEEGNYGEIPEAALVEIACSGTSEVVASLLDRKTKFTITAEVLESASSSKDDKVMKILLEQTEVNQITTRVLWTTARIGTPTKMKLMLDRLGDKTEITSRMMYAAITNSLEMFKMLLDHGATIPDDVFHYAVTNRGGEALLDELENLMGTVIECTEDLLVNAASSGDSVPFLLNRGGIVTEKVIEAAISNSLEIFEILLQHWDGRIQNLQQIVCKAANCDDAYRILTLLLDKQGDVEITPEMLQETVGDPDVLRLLLKRGGTNITEGVLLAIAKHPNCDILVPVLLSEGENVAITEDGLVALLGNLDYGDTARSIVDRTSPVDLTDRVLEAAAGNGKNGDEMLRMLFGRLNEARDTKEIILAAVGNFSCGMRLLALFEEQGIQVEVSSELLKAAASSGSSQMVSELAHRAGTPEITEEILVAAARNMNDVEIMPTFLNDLVMCGLGSA